MPEKIKIIGAGVSGLFLGCCLKRNNYHPIIYEKDLSLSLFGAGVNLSKNATLLLSKLGLKDELISLGYLPERVNFRSFNNASIIKSLSLNKNSDDFISIDRRDLIDVMKKRFLSLNGEIIFDHKCLDIKNSEIYFDNKQKIPTDLVIACDGIKSDMRAKYFDNSSPKFSSLVAWRGMTPRSELSSSSMWDQINIHLGPNGHIVHYPISKGNKINFVAIRKQKKWEHESWISKGNMHELLSVFSMWNENVIELLSKSENLHKWGLYERKPIKKLVKGNLLLMGDAAHPMLPFLAQGSCLAIEDAYSFSELLKKNRDLKKSLYNYQKLRLKRGNKIQFRSRIQGYTNHLSNGFLIFLRNLFLKIFGKSLQTSIHKYNAINEIRHLPN
tara:strand:- start:170 stop:1327 length:1158 start_codon:yes stop_codon:yes gene_type:complete